MAKGTVVQKLKALAQKKRQERLAVKHWRKSTEARIAELEMCGLPGAAKAIARIIRGKT